MKPGEEITEEKVERLLLLGIDQGSIRSVLSCRANAEYVLPVMDVI